MDSLTKSYSELRSDFRDFDLVFFSGADAVSGLIKMLEKYTLDIAVDESLFSHVGMILTPSMIGHVKGVKPDHIYVMESTISGTFGQGIANINGKSFLGVQVRDLDALVSTYGDERIGWAPLSAEHRNKINDNFGYYNLLFQDIFTKYNGIRYDANPTHLLGSMFQCLRCMNTQDDLTKDWLFCSELVTKIYQDLDLFPRNCIAEYVLPMDLLGHDKDKYGIPCIVNKPIIITTKKEKEI